MNLGCVGLEEYLIMNISIALIKNVLFLILVKQEKNWNIKIWKRMLQLLCDFCDEIIDPHTYILGDNFQ